MLDNPKWEAFAQARVLGRSQDEAYAEAGYKPSRSAASRLSTNVSVSARIKELQNGAVQRFEVTTETIARELDAAMVLAIECKQVSAAVAAITTKAKLFGLLTDRSVVNVTHNYSLMTVEELKFEIAAITAEARSIKPGVQH